MERCVSLLGLATFFLSAFVHCWSAATLALRMRCIARRRSGAAPVENLHSPFPSLIFSVSLSYHSFLLPPSSSSHADLLSPRRPTARNSPPRARARAPHRALPTIGATICVALRLRHMSDASPLDALDALLMRLCYAMFCAPTSGAGMPVSLRSASAAAKRPHCFSLGLCPLPALLSSLCRFVCAAQTSALPVSLLGIGWPGQEIISDMQGRRALLMARAPSRRRQCVACRPPPRYWRRSRPGVMELAFDVCVERRSAWCQRWSWRTPRRPGWRQHWGRKDDTASGQPASIPSVLRCRFFASSLLRLMCFGSRPRCAAIQAHDAGQWRQYIVAVLLSSRARTIPFRPFGTAHVTVFGGSFASGGDGVPMSHAPRPRSGRMCAYSRVRSGLGVGHATRCAARAFVRS
ncbi:hypothetical protein C8R47DRAFT_430409 [Mycena vitilis]|nr:hypothetical protein C8R47DRAFT_430409 [Mycena vitilis]